MNQAQVPSNSLEQQIKQTVTLINQTKQRKYGQDSKSRFIIGVCGIPGSGKSTVSRMLQQNLKDSVVLPMDGFHLYRKQLNQQGMIRRGAAFTFDLHKFQQKVLEIKRVSIQSQIKYPNFDHKQKDPVEDAIIVSPSCQIIIIQGLYVFDRNLKLNCKNQQGSSKEDEVWDFKIWVQSDLQTCIQRVAKRHVQSGIQPSYELAYKRASTNDRNNALYVLENCLKPQEFAPINILTQTHTKQNKQVKGNLQDSLNSIIIQNNTNVFA